MTFDKRIWKTGVMAVVATLVFAFVVFRAEEWSKGFNGEFLVYGQTGGTGGGTGSTSGTTGTGGVVTFTTVVPQIAVGSFDGNVTKYSTFVQVINTGTAAVTLSGSFYNENGTPATLLTTTSSSSLPTFAGTFTSLSLPASNSLLISMDAASAATYTPMWGKITSTGAISVVSVFELRDGATNILYTRVGVGSSDQDMRRFVLPRIRNVAAGLDTGFAIVNTGTTAATLTATLYNSAGTPVKTISRLFNPGTKLPIFANSFFELGQEATTGTQYQFMTFESPSPQFAAMGLSIEGANLASVAVDRLQ